jgi:hypothetical protein
MRKGMWFPVPSLEFGAGAVHLMGSRLWTAQGYAKIALHEGYHDLPIPSLAVRGAVSRLIGQKDLDLTIISIDASIGKHVGVGGTWNANPYLGYNVLLMVPRSEVIDPTPNVDGLDPANMDDRQLNFVFKDQDDIIRHRVFFGAKLRYYVFAMTVEGTYAMAGSSIDDRASADECTTSVAHDQLRLAGSGEGPDHADGRGWTRLLMAGDGRRADAPRELVRTARATLLALEEVRGQLHALAAQVVAVTEAVAAADRRSGGRRGRDPRARRRPAARHRGR